MAARIILALFAQALLAQIAFSQCLAGSGIGGGWGGAGNGWGAGLGGAGYGWGAGCGCGGVASTGGGLVIGSSSPGSPVGLSVLSENAYEGTLCSGGNLPFLGTVALEGILPTAGYGAVSYGCGNGAIGINAEAGPIVTGITGPGGYGPGVGALAGNGIAGNGYGIGIGNGWGAGIGGGCGCGCGW